MDKPPAELRPRKRRPNRTSRHRTTERWNDADYAALVAGAEAAGLTVGSYIRSRVLAAPTTRARKQAPVDYTALATVLRAFTKVAVNINQIARHLNMDGIPIPEELATAGMRLDGSRMEVMKAMGRS
jgi:hypothetical protein